MLFEINPTILIDETMNILTDYYEYRRRHKQKYPYGVYVEEDTKFNDLRDYVGSDKCESKLSLLYYIFCGLDIDNLVRTARRWYEKTNWQICLSNETAEKLIRFYSKVEEKTT